MNIIIDSLLFSLIILFSIKLYIANKRFALFINRLFTHIEQAYRKNRMKSPDEIKSFLSIVACISIIIALIALWNGKNFFTAFAIAAFILIPGIPMYLKLIEHQQISEIQRVIEKIRDGSLSKAELIDIKQAIKDYYEQKYTPQDDLDETPLLLSKLTKLIKSIITVRLWPQALIPKITTIPLFSSFFYCSPYHVRFHRFTALCDSVQDHAFTRKFRLHIKEILVANDFFIIEFKDTKKHTKSRAKVLASKIEKEYGLAEGAIFVQENNEQIKFFIPSDSLN